MAEVGGQVGNIFSNLGKWEMVIWISLLGGEGEQWLESGSAVKPQLSESANRLDVAC